MDRAVLETSSDRYVILEYLAEGGMGAVYLGKRLGSDGFEKDVVLKQLLPEYTREPRFIELFLREARLSASLDHANIVRTVDLVHSGDQYFMVMEHVLGGDLRSLIRRAKRRRKRFAPQLGVHVARELLSALGYAHDRAGPDGKPLNLIHRDVSPGNVLVSGEGEVKLSDFGIAKEASHNSVFYKVRGKVGYMSPEQARGEEVDKRTDLFSVGVMLYELLVGERLFVGNLLSSAAMVYGQNVAPPSTLRPELPRELDQLVLKAIALDKGARFQSADAFQDELVRVASRVRLLWTSADARAHLREVCGDDPSAWMRQEAISPDDTAAIAAGTGAEASVTGVTGVGAHGGRADSTGAFDASDAYDDALEPEDAPEAPRSRSAAIPLGLRELTSVIATGGGRAPRAAGNEGAQVQGGGSASGWEDEAPSDPDEFTRPASGLGRGRKGPPAEAPAPPFGAPEPAGAMIPIFVAPGLGERPADTTAPLPVTPSGSAAPAGPASSAAARTARAEAFDTAPTVARTGERETAPGSQTAGGSAGGALGGRSPRLVLVTAVLVLIGVGVALGVAFSGPEVEVSEPVAPAQPPEAPQGKEGVRPPL